MMLLGELVVVDAVDHGEIGARARGGDEHAFGAGGQVLGGALAVGETAGAFHNDVDAKVAPRKLLGRRFGKDCNVLAVGLEPAAYDTDLAGEPPMHAVELEQMSVHRGRAEIVDRDEVEILAAGLEISPES